MRHMAVLSFRMTAAAVKLGQYTAVQAGVMNDCNSMGYYVSKQTI